SNLWKLADLPMESYSCQFDATSHPVPDVAQQQIDISAVRFGAVDQETQLHKHLPDPTPDVCQVDVFGGEIGKQRCEARADAVVHVGGDLPPLGQRRVDDLELELLAELPKPVHENHRGPHSRGQHEPAKCENVEVSDVSRAEIMCVV